MLNNIRKRLGLRIQRLTRNRLGRDLDFKDQAWQIAMVERFLTGDVYREYTSFGEQLAGVLNGCSQSAIRAWIKLFLLPRVEIGENKWVCDTGPDRTSQVAGRCCDPDDAGTFKALVEVCVA